MTDSLAWHDLNAVARAIYCLLARRYAGTGSNNGRIPYSVREAAAELHISKTTASRGLESLTGHGFIVPAQKGAFSLKVRHATEWRLTEFPCDVTGTLTGSKDFMRWQPKIQNSVLPVKLSVPLEKPNDISGETGVAEKSRNGPRGETVEAKIQH